MTATYIRFIHTPPGQTELDNARWAVSALAVSAITGTLVSRILSDWAPSHVDAALRDAVRLGVVSREELATMWDKATLADKEKQWV